MAELLYEPTAAEVEAYRHRRGRKPWTTNKKLRRSHSWPGPFVSRLDEASSLRTAVWLNCAFCGGLFARSVTEVKWTGRHRKPGVPGNLVCSVGCGGRARPRLVRYFVCKLCGQKFLRSPTNYHKSKYCSTACYRQAMREHATARHRYPLFVYAFERGIEPDYAALTCDLCGAAQGRKGRKGRNAPRWKVRITRVNGGYIAWCAACYRRQAQAEKRKLAAMTPAERLRYTQAKELIKELI